MAQHRAAVHVGAVGPLAPPVLVVGRAGRVGLDGAGKQVGRRAIAVADRESRHIGIDPLDPHWNEEPLPFLAPGPYEGKCGELEPCCNRRDPSRGEYVAYPGAMPVPLR